MKNRREPKRREKQKIKLSVRVGALITVLVLIVAAAGILMFPAFDITEVYCEGNVNISSEEIIAAAKLSTGKNTFLENVSGAERRVAKLPLIEEVSIKRVFPDKLCISITERTPAFYAVMGDRAVALDINGIAVKEIDEGQTKRLLAKNVATLDVKQEVEEEPVEEEEPIEEAEPLLSIPVMAGLELSDAKLNKKADSRDDAKLDEVFKLCKTLNAAGILNKSTYIDVTNLGDIIIMIENRLEVHFGNTDNLEYRTKFLAEVITKKLSAYEIAVVDYTGDDIYVRPPNDGKDKVVPKPEEEEKEEKEEEKEEEENEASEPDVNINL